MDRIDVMKDVRLLNNVDYGIPSDKILKDLQDSITWEQNSIRIHGKDIPEPRLTAWYGIYGYRYSGISHKPQPWTSLLLALKKQAEILADHHFNGVLLNLYRDGKDSIGMHSDNEPEFGDCPTIASLSFGSTRTFVFKHKANPSESHKLLLEDSSLLIMAGNTQAMWKHGIPKTTTEVGPRINLTFRNIIHPRYTQRP